MAFYKESYISRITKKKQILLVREFFNFLKLELFSKLSANFKSNPVWSEH